MSNRPKNAQKCCFFRRVPSSFFLMFQKGGSSRSNRLRLLPFDKVEHALRRALLQYAQLAEMMSQCGSFAPDEATVNDFTIKDMDEQVMKKYLLNRLAVAMERNGVNETNLHDYTLEQMAHFVVGGIRLEGLLKELTKKLTK